MQVEMTVVSALFMLPTGLIFPALLRAANTPPASQTLKRAEHLVEDALENVDDEIAYGHQGQEPGIRRVREYSEYGSRLYANEHGHAAPSVQYQLSLSSTSRVVGKSRTKCSVKTDDCFMMISHAQGSRPTCFTIFSSHECWPKFRRE